MIFMLIGGVMIAIAILLALNPPKQMTGFWGYSSYLAGVDHDSFRHAQRWFRRALLTFGAGAMILGSLIQWLHWNRFFIVWLFAATFVVLAPFIYTEDRLRHYLTQHDRLPADAIKPDDQPIPRQRGLRDRKR